MRKIRFHARPAKLDDIQELLEYLLDDIGELNTHIKRIEETLNIKEEKDV